MIQFNNRLTVVLSVMGMYGENQYPLQMGIDRMFPIDEEVSSTAKTFTLKASTFSTEYPLLPKGWDGGAVWVVINNTTGKNRQTYPTNQEQTTDLASDIVVGSTECNEMFRVRSGNLCTFEPVDASNLFLYAPNTDATARVSYFPIN
jgi:hypothetical protein